MVKNEASIIERCILSVRDHIDAYVIQDTGSTDRTPEMAEKLLDGIPGVVYNQPFESFGVNRTDLLRGNQQDYHLMLDADMELVVDEPLGDLSAGCYMTRIKEGNLVYRLPLLISTDPTIGFHYDGSTHEYVDGDIPFSRDYLDVWSVIHHCDGVSRADKLTRDRVLLEGEFDKRSIFYLAQTYAEQGYRQAAADLYGARAALGGWGEEAFYARYRQGVLLGDTGLLWQAWNMRPTRAEPLMELARIYYHRGAMADYERVVALGKAIPIPNDGLFVHTDCYGEAWD